MIRAGYFYILQWNQGTSLIRLNFKETMELFLILCII